MRPEAPNGGVQDRVLDLRAAGYLSTGALTTKLGLTGSMPVSFIVNELGITPRVIGHARGSYYWAPEQVRQVRQALVLRLLRDEFTGEAA